MTAESFIESKEQILPSATYLELKQDYRNTGDDVHIFVEDEDDFEFYRTVINHVFYNFNVFKYSMKGKKNVIDTFKLVDWNRYKKQKMLFFADKDYDDILNIEQVNSENFFYTKHYSIENYLVTEEIFLIILDRFYHNKINTSLKTKLINCYKDAYNNFIIKMRTLTWFILIDREKSKKAKLDKLKLEDFIFFEKMEYYEKKLITKERFDKIQRNSKSTKKEKNTVRFLSIKEIISQKCGADENLINFENIMQKRDLLISISDHKKFIRGKYDLWFLIEILKTVDKKIEEIYQQENIIITEQDPMPRKKFEITTSLIFDLVSSKIAHPVDIKEFLITNFKNLHGNN